MGEFDDKIIRDAACGLIHLSKTELKIIDLPIFQRLRRVSQNGFLSNIFPSATHSRFSHSLGVLYYANLMCRQLNLDQEKIKVIRLAALLHDIGHGPFSHTIENIYKGKLPINIDPLTSESEDKTKIDFLRELERIDLVKQTVKIHKDNTRDRRELLGHEIIGSMIIENHPDINNILKDEFKENFEKSKLDIQKSICGDIDDARNMGILHSELDADKCDYLIRDSLFSGVKYGLYEFQHILNNMEIDENTNGIVFKYKALKSIEHFMFSRYFLYNQIYNHKTNLGFNWLSEKAYESLLENNMFIHPKELIVNMDKKEFDIFDVYDDFHFFNSCKELHRNLLQTGKLDENQEFNLEVINKVIKRQPLKHVLTCESFINTSDGSLSEDFVLVREFLTDRTNRMSHETKIPPRWIITDRKFDVPITKIPNKVSSSNFSQLTRRNKEEEIMIKYNERDIRPIGEVVSSIINPLANLNLIGQFLFTKDEEYKSRIIKYMNTNEKHSSKFIIKK